MFEKIKQFVADNKSEVIKKGAAVAGALVGIILVSLIAKGTEPEEYEAYPQDDLFPEDIQPES